MPSKKVSMSASMSNQTSHFGIMGGLYNRKISGRSSQNRVTSRLVIPVGADAGLIYMKMKNLLSRNPLGSGGVGRMFNIKPRGSGLKNHLGDSLEKNVNNVQDINDTYEVSSNHCVPNPTCSALAEECNCCAEYYFGEGCRVCLENSCSDKLYLCDNLTQTCKKQYTNIGTNQQDCESTCTKNVCTPEANTNKCSDDYVNSMNCCNDSFDSSSCFKCIENSIKPPDCLGVDSLPGYTYGHDTSYCCLLGYNQKNGCIDRTKVCSLTSGVNKCDISLCRNSGLSNLIFIQADGLPGEPGANIYNMLHQISLYRKSEDLSQCYFDKVVIFAANIDDGQDVSNVHGCYDDKRCWQKQHGCNQKISLSFNASITNFLCNTNGNAIDMFKKLQNIGVSISLSIVGNHSTGGWAGFNDVASAEYFINSIDTVFKSFSSTSPNILSYIDNINIDDEYSDPNECNTTCNRYEKSYEYLNTALNNSIWKNKVSICWFQGFYVSQSTTVSELLNISENIHDVIAMQPSGNSNPVDTCNSGDECKKLYDDIPLNKWYYRIVLHPGDYVNKNLPDIDEYGKLKGLAFWTYKETDDDLEDTSLSEYNKRIKVAGLGFGYTFIG